MECICWIWQWPKTTLTAIFGRYLAKMKLKQFSKYNFADTEICWRKDAKFRIKLKNSRRYAYRCAIFWRISTKLRRTRFNWFHRKIQQFFPKPEELFEGIEFFRWRVNKDKTYLVQKWIGAYTIPECIKLEKVISMMDSYDIRTASHLNYLLKICRISLKIDQALEVNDIDGFNDKVYDLLMKSAKLPRLKIKSKVMTIQILLVF